jgi:hypothetical protein
MALDFIQERQQAHAYLDRLPPEQLSAGRGLLETMLDPVSRALANAPVEDEEISDEEECAVAESRQTHRNTRSSLNPADASHKSMALFTQSGTGTVRTCRALPTKSTMAQWSSRR